jgi:hypothetical protein
MLLKGLVIKVGDRTVENLHMCNMCGKLKRITAGRADCNECLWKRIRDSDTESKS